MKKNINQISDYNKKIIFLLVGFSLAARLVSSYFFHDNQLEYEWKNLVHNLITYKVYSYFDPSIPSVMMPPLYAYFLYCIKILTFEKVDFLCCYIAHQFQSFLMRNLDHICLCFQPILLRLNFLSN